MINTFIIVIFCLLLSLLEPLFLVPFGFSIFLIGGVVLNSKKNKYLNLYLVVGSVVIDLVFKNYLGTYLISFLTYLFTYQLIGRVIPEDSGTLEFLKIFVSLYLAYLMLSVLTSFSISISTLSMVLLPSLISSFFVLALSTILNWFNSETSGSKLKL